MGTKLTFVITNVKSFNKQKSNKGENYLGDDQMNCQSNMTYIRVVSKPLFTIHQPIKP